MGKAFEFIKKQELQGNTQNDKKLNTTKIIYNWVTAEIKNS